MRRMLIAGTLVLVGVSGCAATAAPSFAPGPRAPGTVDWGGIQLTLSGTWYVDGACGRDNVGILAYGDGPAYLCPTGLAATHHLIELVLGHGKPPDESVTPQAITFGGAPASEYVDVSTPRSSIDIYVPSRDVSFGIGADQLSDAERLIASARPTSGANTCVAPPPLNGAPAPC